jgi:hypothetical protein
MRYITPLLLLSSSASAAAIGNKAPKGFVTREGEVFKLDGKDFYFAGSNAYYLPFNDVSFPRHGSQIRLTCSSSLPTSKRASLLQRRPD